MAPVPSLLCGSGDNTQDYIVYRLILGTGVPVSRIRLGNLWNISQTVITSAFWKIRRKGEDLLTEDYFVINNVAIETYRVSQRTVNTHVF